jgi:signal transduction histidine kinase
MTRLRSRVSRLPLRVRLVAGFSAAMLVVLAATGAFVYWRVEYALDRGLDSELQHATAVIGPLVGPAGRVSSPAAANATGVGWQVLDHEGAVIAAGGPAPQTSLIPESRLDELDAGARTFDVGTFLPASDAPYRVRVTTLPGGAAATTTYLLVGVRRDHRDEALRELLLQLGVAGFAALAIASVVGDLLARAALAPVERYRRRAAEIATGGDHLRLDVPAQRDDEVTRLGHTLNEMLAALREALDRERRFVDDASHELRTPLTLLRSRIQLARRRPRTVEEHERVLDELGVDVGRLADLAEQLLATDRQAAAAGAECDVVGVVGRVVQRWRAAEQGRSPDLVVDLPEPPVTAAVDAHALERIVTNLVGNAFAHGRPPVHVEVRSEGGRVLLSVADAGTGMPPDLLTEATRRFTRAPEARARSGAGLGLSIVEQLVGAAGGELRLCCGGHHTSAGRATGVPCRHDGRMTVTVLLPASTSS